VILPSRLLEESTDAHAETLRALALTCRLGWLSRICYSTKILAYVEKPIPMKSFLEANLSIRGPIMGPSIPPSSRESAQAPEVTTLRPAKFSHHGIEESTEYVEH